MDKKINYQDILKQAQNSEKQIEETLKLTYNFLGFETLKDMILQAVVEHPINSLLLIEMIRKFIKQEDVIKFNAFVESALEYTRDKLKINYDEIN